jgi:predicted DNA-binding transcriptional regulator YafY
MKASKSKSKIIKAQPTQEKVLKLLVYLLEAEGPVSMISLEKLYGGGDEVDTDKRRSIFRHLDLIENKWGIELIRGDHYSIKKKAAFQSVELSSLEAQALYFSAGDIVDADLRLMTQAKLLRIYQERRKKEDLIPKRTLELMDWCDVHISKAKVRYQMRIKRYSSINSGVIADRLVVPISFNLENLEVYAYDLEDRNMLKVFKLERMDGIEKLKEKAPKELKLDKLDIKRDPFGYLIEGKELKYLDLRMDLKAFILFSLHFSKLVPRIEKLEVADNAMPYRIELELLRVDPLAGWLFGLLSHVEIVGSSDFKESLWKFYQNNVDSQIQTKLQS